MSIPHDGEGARHPLEKPTSRSPPLGENQEEPQKHEEDITAEDSISTPAGWKNQPDKNGNDRMCMMREKMTTCRKKKDFHERRKVTGFLQPCWERNSDEK